MATGHDIIVIGASGGGVDALATLVKGLPVSFPGAIFVVIHVDAAGPHLLPSLLDNAGPLPAVAARDGEVVRHGVIYVASPDYHLVLNDAAIRLTRSPRENRHRPAVDPLFRSAARAYGPRVVGVVLTGSFDDGTSGLAAIKARGGIAVVQDPAEALFPGMPQAALRDVAVDHCVQLRELPALLVQLASTPVPSNVQVADAAPAGSEEGGTLPEPGSPSTMSCPTCHGVLWETNDVTLPRFTCRIGHSFSQETLLAEQADDLETALWGAVRALRESAAMEMRLAAVAVGSIAERHRESATAKTSQARMLRQMILGSDPAPVVEDREEVIGCGGSTLKPGS